MKKILLATALLLGLFAAADAQQAVSPCTKIGQTSCAPVSATAPLPVTGTITVTPSGQQNVNLNQLNGATISNANPLPVNPVANVGVVGNVNAGSADSGQPVKTGGKYNSSVVFLSNGQRGDTQLDVQGRTLVSQASTIFTTGQVAVGTSATLVVLGATPASLVRITNTGTTVAYCGATGVTTTTGDYLAGVAGTTQLWPTTASIYCVVATGTATLSFTQFD